MPAMPPVVTKSRSNQYAVPIVRLAAIQIHFMVCLFQGFPELPATPPLITVPVPAAPYDGAVPVPYLILDTVAFKEESVKARPVKEANTLPVVVGVTLHVDPNPI